MADEGARGRAGCTSGADFTLENSGNGAGKEELRSRGGSHSYGAKNLALGSERVRIGIRWIVAEEGETRT